MGHSKFFISVIVLFSFLQAQEPRTLRVWVGAGLGASSGRSFAGDVGSAAEWSAGGGNDVVQVKFVQSYLFRVLLPVSMPVSHLRTQSLLLGGRIPLRGKTFVTVHLGGGGSANITAGMEQWALLAQRRVVLSDERSNCTMMQLGLDHQLDEYSGLVFDITLIRNSFGSYGAGIIGMKLGLL